MLESVWRVCFRLLYNECAFTYDLVSRSVSLGHWKRWQRSVFSHLPAPDAGVILELAHGTGDLQIDLLRSGYETIALDVSPQMGKSARRKLGRLGMLANLLRADALKLPFKAGSLAGCVCTFPTRFIFHPQTLAELERVLAPSGQVVIVLAGLLRGGGLVRRLIRGLYALTGQEYVLLSDEFLHQYFGRRRLDFRPLVETIDGSVVQLVLMRKAREGAEEFADIRLDLAGNS